MEGWRDREPEGRRDSPESLRDRKTESKTTERHRGGERERERERGRETKG